MTKITMTLSANADDPDAIAGEMEAFAKRLRANHDLLPEILRETSKSQNVGYWVLMHKDNSCLYYNPAEGYWEVDSKDDLDVGSFYTSDMAMRRGTSNPDVMWLNVDDIGREIIKIQFSCDGSPDITVNMRQWLETASHRSIKALASQDWEMSDVPDQLFQDFCDAGHPDVREMAEIVAFLTKGAGVDFAWPSVKVLDVDAAKTWLEKNRPSVFDLIKYESPEP